MASRRRSASLSPKTRAPNASRSSTPSFTTPGNAASIGAKAAPPLACRAWTAASASYTGTPICRSIFAAVDLPMPMDPVRPTIIIERCTSALVPGHQDGLAGRLAPLEIDMVLRRLAQRIALVDGDLHLAALDH